MTPVRLMFWNGAWQISADIPGNEGRHQTVTLPNYCNEQEAMSIATIIWTAHVRQAAKFSETPGKEQDYDDALKEAYAMSRGVA